MERIVIERVVDVRPPVVLAEFGEREWEHLKLERTAREQRRKIARQQKRVRAGDEDVVALRGVEAVDGTLEPFAHLNLVDQEEVYDLGLVPVLHVVEESMVFGDPLEVVEVVVDVDDVRVCDVCQYVIAQRFEKLGLAASPYPGDHLDIGRAHHVDERFQIACSLDEPHPTPPAASTILSHLFPNIEKNRYWVIGVQIVIDHVSLN